ncbi:hypothetical protein PPYR_09079, partial [Photinus pyralis]
MSTNSTEDYDCSSESTCLLKAELEIALRRISEIEEKLEELDMQIPKKYADVPRLNYLRKKRILVYGTGNQTRSFMYVSDLVEGLIALMESSYSSPVNIGNPIEFTIN